MIDTKLNKDKDSNLNVTADEAEICDHDDLENIVIDEGTTEIHNRNPLDSPLKTSTLKTDITLMDGSSMGGKKKDLSAILTAGSTGEKGEKEKNHSPEMVTSSGQSEHVIS